jgi:hypothetical protein
MCSSRSGYYSCCSCALVGLVLLVAPQHLWLFLSLFPAAAAVAAGALYEGRGTYGDVITYAERLFGRIRQAVACQAAPTTLKAAFLDPVEAGSMATEVALELFAKADADFLTMFTGGCITNESMRCRYAQ